MKTILTLGLLAASAVVATPAMAARSASYTISGTLSPSCSITAPANQTINPTSTASQPIGVPSYVCNFAGPAAIRFWSQNGSVLQAPNGSVSYSFVFDGSGPFTLPNAEPALATLSRSIATAGTAQTGAASITISAGASVAGTYSDTISMSINP
jgi:hypothetical protein